jgi:hypothetical protein
MSRLYAIWLTGAVLALLAALLVSCGGTPAAVSGPQPTSVAPSPGVVAVTTEPTTGLLPTELPTTLPSAPPTPTLPAASQPTDTAPPPTSPPTDTPPPATKRPTDTPLPTSLPTDTPLPPTAAPAAPLVISFTANPTITQNVGDVVHLAWETSGQRAELCPLIGSGPTGCQDVPLAGEQDFVIDETALGYIGLVLYARDDGKGVSKSVSLRPQCQNLRRWFFDNPPLRCPEDDAVESYAAGQYFERGLMMWVEDTDTFYVFYEGEDEHGRQSFDWVPAQNVKPGASAEDRIGEDPPPGLYEPVSGFGLVWRGEVEGIDPRVRERIGWATEPEFGFTTAKQCQVPAVPGAWSCYLRGPRGEIIRHGAVTNIGYPIVWDYHRAEGQ